MTFTERCNIAQTKNACFNCLKIGHSYKKCRYNRKCSWCSRKHVLLMCREVSSASTGTQPSSKEEKKKEEHNLANFSSEPEVFLQTLRINLINGGKQRSVRALLDPGSHRSYILGEIAEELGYEAVGTRVMSHLLFGGAKTKPQEHKGYLLHLRSLNGEYTCNFQAYDQPVICQTVQSLTKGPWLHELQRQSIQLTDLGPGDPTIGLLIGADVVGKLYTGRKVDLQCGATALETHLGWTMLGKNNDAQVNRTDTTLLTVSMFVKDASVSQLWRLDTLGITDPVEQKSKEEQQKEVLRRFRETTTINDDNRYEVLLPWRENHPSLPDNRVFAEKRLQSTLKRLEKSNLMRDYEEVFDEWIADGIIEEVPEDEISNPAHYLPHRPVVKEGSTTRIRPVFDASARDGKGPSLNQCLDPGPNLIEDIPRLFRRFRAKPIGIIADIRRAFLQISIDPKIRDRVRFLWQRSQKPGSLVHYRHCRVAFGLTCSPFLLGGTIELHLDEMILQAVLQRVRDLLEQLKVSFYVDNCVTSVETPQEAEFFRQVAIAAMSQGGFDLRGWEFSHIEDENTVSPVLGLAWNKQQDTLALADEVLMQKLPEHVTKRTILSVTQKVFDPLGMACPTLLIPKIILQKLWNTSLDWDTEVPADIRGPFDAWCQQLPLLKDLKLPRWVLGNETDTLSLHLFVDASRDAYAAVVYARIESEGNVRVEFVEAKSRVAPKERTTIPRLELLAATVGARLLHSVHASLGPREIDMHCWSDSSTALTWILHDRPWATFVSNRVHEIRQLTNVDNWRHIPGEYNPADLPSRGCSPQQLIQTNWIRGPEWLRLPPEQWPVTSVSIDEVQVNSELKKSVQKVKSRKVDVEPTVNCVAGAKLEPEVPKLWYLRFPTYVRIVRHAAWMKRFIYNASHRKEQRTTGDITPKEFRLAELTLMRTMQEESFDGEKDPRLAAMVTYRDRHGLLRLRSLVENREDTSYFRHPIILDPHHQLVEKLIEYQHESLGHAPIDTVICQLRERVWILQCRKAVRTVVQRCAVCRRYGAKHVESPPATLPAERVRDAKIFEITGVDFTGPLYLQNGEKVWICLFTCAVYRAVHLELVSSLSTVAFLEALRRLISRKGRPSIIFADNGTNFKGARNQLRGLNWKRISKCNTVKPMEWRFNPPSAPWWGGWWERLVGLVKDLLRKMLRRALLTYEELSTVLCDCEITVNSRPLTYLAEDSQQLVPLTPRAFLQDLDEAGVPDLDALDSTSLNKRLRYVQSVREQLRQRFRSEYLGQLQSRGRKMSFYKELKVGDIVLCGSETQKRLDWPLARVVHLYPGRDGYARVAKIKTATGELTRPVQRLYPLEVPLLETEDLRERAEDVAAERLQKANLPETVKSPATPKHANPAACGSSHGLSAEGQQRQSATTRDDEGPATEPLANEPPVIATRRGRTVKLPSRYSD